MKWIKQISTWLLKISSTRLMIASLALMIGFMVFVLPDQARKSAMETGSERSPDTSFYYTPDDLYQMAEEYGETGRKAYIHARWTFDLVFPLVYTSFLAIGISWFIQRLPGWGEIWKWANLVPLLGGIIDLLENTAASLAFSTFPNRLHAALVSASVLTPIKWVLVSASFIPYFLFGVAWLVRVTQQAKG